MLLSSWSRRRPASAAVVAGVLAAALISAGALVPAGAAVPSGGPAAPPGAVGVVDAPQDLAPVHAEPPPSGVSLTGGTGTATLLARANLRLAALASAGDPVPSGPTAPVGTPGIRTLTQHVAPSCSGTGADGHRVQVLYLHDASRTDRFASVQAVLRSEVANVDDVFALSARQTGGERRVRWVHTADCLPLIKDVAVPKGSLDSDIWTTISAVKALGYKRVDRHYLMFADSDRLCGVGTLYDDASPTGNENDGVYASYARVDAPCWSSDHSTAAHELTHTLGGVLSSAPHATTNGHCSDEFDIMCYDDSSGIAMRQVCPPAQEQLLDCGHDDYFNTDPAPGSFLAEHWNVARSSFLDTVAPSVPAPEVSVAASAADALSGGTVTFTAASSRTVSWSWTATEPRCTLTPGAETATAQTAALVCPAGVTGRVGITAHAIESGSGGGGAGTAFVAVTTAPAPTAVVTAPEAVAAGTPFAVRVSATGTDLGYRWQADDCTVDAPTEAATTVTCPSAATTRSLPVRVVVTQGDGQLVTGSATVRVNADESAPTPTPAPSTVTSWTTPRLRGGVVSAVLRTSSGHPLARRPVLAQVRWRGSRSWATLSRPTSDASGQVAVRLEDHRAGWVRFSSPAGTGFRGSVSGSTYVKVAVRLRMRRPSHHHVVATLRTLSGSTVRNASVTLQRRTRDGAPWVTVARSRTGPHGGVSRLVRPIGRTWFRWVFPGEAVHLGTHSGFVRIS